MILVLSAVGITHIMNLNMKRRHLTVNPLLNINIVTLVTVSLFLFGGVSLWTLKGLLIALVLLYASVQDASTHEADDSLWVMLLLIGFIGITKADIFSMLAGAFAVFVPQMAVVLFLKSRAFGGADIKISTAAAFCMGFMGGTLGYVIGLLLAVVIRTVYVKMKKINVNDGFALLPFISVGLMIGYFI